MQAPRQTVVETLARELAHRILDGTLPAGARLPSVRALAAEHDVNVSTVQRVLGRLAELGLVEAHDRRGVEVCDVTRTGGAALWPLRLERAAADPEPAVALLRDSLAVRRWFAVQVLGDLARIPYAQYQAAFEAHVRAFVERTRDPAVTPGDLLKLESEIFRELLIAAKRPAVLAIVNDVQAMLLGTPAVLTAIYREPEVAAQAWNGLQLMLSSGFLTDPEGIAGVEAMLDDMDGEVVEDFCRQIGMEA